jgi:hypothetical protein
VKLKGALAATGLFITLSVWGFASPPGSAPDDDFHLPSIWCAQGLVDGKCDPEVPGDGFGKTPDPLAPVAICFAFQSDISAACQSTYFDWNNKELRGSKINENKRFPNGFYWTMHLFTGDNILASAMIMRIINSLIAVVMLFSALFVLSNRLRIPLIAAWLAATIPLALFTIPSTNPSSWTIIGLSVFWAVLINSLIETDKKKILLSQLLMVISAALALSSRSESGPFLIVITASVFILLQGWNHLNIVDIKKWLLPIILVLVSLYEFFTTPSTLGISTGLPGGDENRTAALVWTTNIMRLPALYSGSLGSWNLGWMDTPVPDMTFFFAMFIFAGFIFVGLSQMEKYKTLAVLFLLALMAYMPLRILALGKNVIGENVQPRYFLPLLFFFIGLMLFSTLKNYLITFSSSQLIFTAFALSIAHAFALHAVMRRYITGTDVVSWNLNRKAEWWWEPLPSPMTTWFIAVLAYSLVISIAVSYINDISKKSLQQQL